MYKIRTNNDNKVATNIKVNLRSKQYIKLNVTHKHKIIIISNYNQLLHFMHARILELSQ